jgi:hypothetical protein
MQTLRFEDQVAMLHSQGGHRIGHEVKRSESISDLFILSSKGEKWIVRCVNLSEVDSSIAYDLIQLMQSEKAQQGSIITRGIINSSVAQLVKGKPIHLVDGKKLQDYLDRLQPQPQHSTLLTDSATAQSVDCLKFLDVYLAGVMYDNRYLAVPQLSIREQVWLRHEFNNPQDANAIVAERQSGLQIGYIRWTPLSRHQKYYS